MKQILLVEDNTDMAVDIKDKLRLMNHSCVAVATLEQALTALEGSSFDLAIISLNLEAEYESLDLADIILTSYFIPVIFTTDSPRDSRVKTAGATVCLTKPIDYNTLFSSIFMSMLNNNLKQW